MAMVHSSIFSPNFIHLQPSTNSITKIASSFPSSPTKYHNNLNSHTRNFRLPRVASIPHPPINVGYLETEFSGHGASFTSLGESCVVRMGLDNGSVATLMLPSGLITSYKAPMWHGGLLELLHTSVSEGEDGGGAVIRGGVSLAFRCEGGGDEENGEISWSPSIWSLRNVGGSPQGSIQVELIASDSEHKIQIKHIVTLQNDAISSEIVITNFRPSSLRLMGSIIGHLAVSTPEATFAVGLESSNYFVKPPIFSNFSIIPPDFNKNDSDSRNSWGPTAFKQLLSGWGMGNPNDGRGDKGQKDEEMEGEEDGNYKHLTEKLSLIYTSAPRSFTIMDRGKRNSVVLGREGFNELYLFSPGSSHKSYGKYSYICIGQAALLKPVTIGPESEWRGVQHLHNPNL
ncbi:protein NDH-DEPENDENT CYCLIC ELECTRON FLOW 5 [Cynara cardunculus var. scolymus]|uniref:protein NDH-DEPENDENT CYCLIC ELECTRON FLOW 5 n=1 Tax=Cynara cardunculus var. scolymus TaxID=59895 RepID=UPI000D626BC6|nr:protein NDH-DEPENDENT CYCLIC ELECTRON FLOW 5 [Cynara cardunculus var. scolymus]